MLMTIRTAHRPATDLGFLLHKHPEHAHTREFSFGNATVFCPEATEGACTAAILLDVDPVGMVRGRGGKGGAEDQYVNDRPHVASSLLSVVLSRWFNSALGGRCERKPESAAAPLPTGEASEPGTVRRVLRRVHSRDEPAPDGTSRQSFVSEARSRADRRAESRNS
jgi:hypothetical protein